MYNNPALSTLEEIRKGWIHRVSMMKVREEDYRVEIKELEQLIEDLSNVIADLEVSK